MGSLSEERLQSYRARTFRLPPARALKNIQEAVDYANERGFIYFWPIKGVTLPSLWTAVAGDREVANAHDDPGHVTWGWKDELLDKRCWYYAKVLRGKASIISLEIVPHFYALSRNFGEPEADYLEQYQDGLLSLPAKSIFETILSEGPMDTVNLRRKIRMTSRASDSPFARGLVELQRDFKILPVGVARTGGWRYSFVYEAVHRHFPDLAERARSISEQAARAHLVSRYFESVGAATAGDVKRLFQWSLGDVRAALHFLDEQGFLASRSSSQDPRGETPYALTQLLDTAVNR